MGAVARRAELRPAGPSFIAAAGGLSGDAALEARDLLARIDRATAPYFE